MNCADFSRRELLRDRMAGHPVGWRSGYLVSIGQVPADAMPWDGVSTFSSISDLPTLDFGLMWRDYGGGVYFDYATGQIEVLSTLSVPEPHSIVTLGCFIGLAVLRRRRRK